MTETVDGRNVQGGAALPVYTVNKQGGRGVIYDDSGNPALVKRTFANVAASQTDSSLVAIVANKRIRVLAVVAVGGATATTLTFNSKGGGAGTAKTCLFANAANGGFVLPFCEQGWFDTNTSEGLSVTTGAGSTTGIQVVYAEV